MSQLLMFNLDITGGLKVLEASKYWRPQSTGGLKVLDASKYRIPKSTGGRKVLENAKYWRHQSAGGIKVLEASKYWRSQSTGGLKVLAAHGPTVPVVQESTVLHPALLVITGYCKVILISLCTVVAAEYYNDVSLKSREQLK